MWYEYILLFPLSKESSIKEVICASVQILYLTHTQWRMQRGCSGCSSTPLSSAFYIIVETEPPPSRLLTIIGFWPRTVKKVAINLPARKSWIRLAHPHTLFLLPPRGISRIIIKCPGNPMFLCVLYTLPPSHTLVPSPLSYNYPRDSYGNPG